MFPYHSFYTSNYAIFWDSEKKTRPYTKLIYNEISHKKIHMSDGPESLLYAPSLRISFLAIK